MGDAHPRARRVSEIIGEKYLPNHNRPVRAMERVSRAFLFHEELATQDEGASLEEALEHVLWYVLRESTICFHISMFHDSSRPRHPAPRASRWFLRRGRGILDKERGKRVTYVGERKFRTIPSMHAPHQTPR